MVTNIVGLDKVLNFIIRAGNHSEESEDRIREVICWKPENVRKYEETTKSKIFKEEEDTKKDCEILERAVQEAMESKHIVEKR